MIDLFPNLLLDIDNIYWAVNKNICSGLICDILV